jgi:Cu-Zn family superoxide dismutase
MGDVTNSIIGKSVVIHDGVDDLGKGGLGPNGEVVDPKKRESSLKTGNAGGRMACAIIGMSKSE